ncbi:hypothetical protein KIW84_024744 [Lathyrus oleraceus]|uniref:E3 ubiquitin-protein ligase RMA n=1 Tax=Pisum sativum TaxID=3888 RepID=A0A9D4YGD1_PEA|nr:hypothetical protein KIW84_024744 [Pisum sativum]
MQITGSKSFVRRQNNVSRSVAQRQPSVSGSVVESIVRMAAYQRVPRGGSAAYQRVSHGLGGTMRSATVPNPSCSSGNRFNDDASDFECNICFNLAQDPVITLCGHLFCWPCLYKWLHHRSHPEECPVWKGVVGEEKLVPLYGKGRSVTDPRTKIPPRPSDIHTLFASLEQTRLSREATEQRFKEYIDQCIEEFCVAQEQRIALLQEAKERRFQQLECQQRINEFRAECRVETEQRIKECRAETKQRTKECRVEYGAVAGQRIKECREEAERRVVGEEKLVPLYGKGRSVTDPRTEIPPRPSDIHTLFASLEQTRLSREATEQRFKEYIDQCIEEFCVAQEQHYRIKKFRAEAEQRIKECRAEATQRIRECRGEYRADAEQRIKKLRADAEQRINEFRAECRVETEQRIKECRAETKQRIKECRVEYGVAAGQRIKECREEAEQRINEFRVWLHHRSHPQECPVCKGVVGEEKLVPLYGKGRSVTDPRTEIPPRPSDIHTLFASLEQTRLSREATKQRFKEYIDQCIEEFCVAQEQHYRIKKFRAEAEQRIKECRAEAAQRIKECRGEYRVDAEQRIKKLRADAEQRINAFRMECRVETEQRIKECRLETEQRIKECRVEYGAAAGQRINEFRADPVITLYGHLFCWPCLYKWLHHRSHRQECPVCKGVVGEEKLVPLYGKGRSVTDPRTKIPPRPSDIHTLFASLEQTRLSREATEQRFKEYIDQCIEEFSVAQEQRIALLQESQERRFQQLECRIKECRADADYRIKKFRAEAEQRIKECYAEADQRIRECRAEYPADAEQRIKKLRADAEQRINEFRTECRVETEQRIKECRAETKQRIKECRVEYGLAAGQRIKECREEAERRINEFHAIWEERLDQRLHRIHHDPVVALREKPVGNENNRAATVRYLSQRGKGNARSKS